MRVTITIDMDNAAFEDTPGIEVARILKVVAERVQADPSNPDDWGAPRLRDINGNAVGEVLIDD